MKFAAVLWSYGAITASSVFPVLLTMPLFLLISSQLYKIDRIDFTAADMLWLCAMLFFVIAPNQSISDLSFLQGPTTGITYTFNDFFEAESIVFLSFSIFICAQSRFTAPIKTCNSWYKTHDGQIYLARYRKILEGIKRQEVTRWSKYSVFFLIAIFMSSIGYILTSGGLANIMLPRQEKDFEQMSFFSTAFLSVLSVTTVILAKIFAHRILIKSAFIRIFITLFFSLSVLLLLLFINPLNSARFFILAAWVPVALSLFGARLKYSYAYIAILFGIMILMPIMSISSRTGFSGLYDFLESSYAEKTFMVKDMDVFDMLVHLVKIYNAREYDFGSNVIAIALFFIPRSYWPGKPRVGGLTIGEDLVNNAFAGTDNLSMFVAGDLYMDFGWIGIIIGSFIIGKIWKYTNKSFTLDTFNNAIVAPLLTGSIPILMRGPVGAVIGFFFCLLISSFFYKIILKRNFCVVLMR